MIKRIAMLPLVMLPLCFAVLAQSPTPSPTPTHSAESLSSTAKEKRSAARFVYTCCDYLADEKLFNQPIPDSVMVGAGQTYKSKTYLRSKINSQYQIVEEKGSRFVRILWFILAGLGVILVIGSFFLLYDFPKPAFAGVFLLGCGMIAPMLLYTDWNALHDPNIQLYFDNAGDSPATVVIDGKEMFDVNPKSYAAAKFYKDDLGGKTASIEIVILSADKTERERSVQRIETYAFDRQFVYNIGQANEYWEESANFGDNPFSKFPRP